MRPKSYIEEWNSPLSLAYLANFSIVNMQSMWFRLMHYVRQHSCFRWSFTALSPQDSSYYAFKWVWCFCFVLHVLRFMLLAAFQRVLLWNKIYESKFFKNKNVFDTCTCMSYIHFLLNVKLLVDELWKGNMYHFKLFSSTHYLCTWTLIQ